MLSGQKPDYAAHLGAAGTAVVEGSAGHIATQRAVSGSDLRREGRRDAHAAYRGRNRQRNFPHVHRRFNERGVPDSLGADPLGVSDVALLAFVRAIAVSEHVLAKEAILEESAPSWCSSAIGGAAWRASRSSTSASTRAARGSCST